ncbi:hypothetical protein BpHYR1_009714 [Brachionus plicatilis]|uniref:Uncharacterized protein n=1 Tax=Brachionus plicatilis TaxID=10195 RepID=A0A3M7PVV6_BRAPC|nr:hypothetical protein BpHYR1_009714 [Brachionus plicatilis]
MKCFNLHSILLVDLQDYCLMFPCNLFEELHKLETNRFNSQTEILQTFHSFPKKFKIVNRSFKDRDTSLLINLETLLLDRPIGLH